MRLIVGYSNRMSFQYQSESLKKKRRVSGKASITPHYPFPNSYFLNSFDEVNPILILVSPLRSTQKSIFKRNLEQAGAHVLASAQDLSVNENERPRSIIVVTDDLQRARGLLSATRYSGDEIRFVSTKWASAILSAKKNLPYDPFVLAEDKPSRQLSQAASSSKITNKAKGVLPEKLAPPVWCTCEVKTSSDSETKKALFKRVPSLQCERSTLSPSLYAIPNAELCNLLDNVARKRELEYADVSEHEADIRARAYRRASAALKCVPFRLSAAEDVMALDALGPRVLSAIREYLQTGSIAEASMLQNNARLRTLLTFKGLYGVGIKSALHFYDKMQITSLAELHQRVKDSSNLFNKALVEYMRWQPQLVRPTRHIVYEFCGTCLQVANEGIGGLGLRGIVAGGLRRGENDGHDADIVYCRRRETSDKTDSVMDVLREKLLQAGLIKCVLWENTNVSGWGEVNFGVRKELTARIKGKFTFGHDLMHAIGQLKGRLFRVDFVGVRDAQEMPFATLAWSGSTMFQRDLRSAAEKLGWTFNDHGLFDRVTGERIVFQPEPCSEMDVFVAMGLTYRPPFERCG